MNETVEISQVAQEKSISEKNNSFSEIENLNTNDQRYLLQKAKLNNKTVLIKRMNKEFCFDEKYRELFYQEFEIFSQLSNSHIIKTISKGEDNEGEFFCTEFFETKSLSQFFKNSCLEDGEFAKQIALQLLETLEYLHKKQIFLHSFRIENLFVKKNNNQLIFNDFDVFWKPFFNNNYSLILNAKNDIIEFGNFFLQILTGQSNDTNLAEERGQNLAQFIFRCQKGEFESCATIFSELQNMDILDFKPETKILNIIESLQTEKTKRKKYNWFLIAANLVVLSAILLIFWKSEIWKPYEHKISDFSKQKIRIFNGIYNGNSQVLNIFNINKINELKIQFLYSISDEKNVSGKKGSILINPKGTTFIELENLGTGKLFIKKDSFEILSLDKRWKFSTNIEGI